MSEWAACIKEQKHIDIAGINGDEGRGQKGEKRYHILSRKRGHIQYRREFYAEDDANGEVTRA